MKKFDEFHVSEIIEYNKIECSRRNESFNVKLELLLEIIDKTNQLSYISDDRSRVLKQASTFMGLIVFEQPFNSANKSTATVVAIDFLHSNGFDFDVRDIRKQSELLGILEKVMYLFEDESQKGIFMVRELLEKHVKKLH